jgi:H2-forming N5,N10-methylenetetrahydromethanopterin dehydrogenase-like enzyme
MLLFTAGALSKKARRNGFDGEGRSYRGARMAIAGHETVVPAPSTDRARKAWSKKIEDDPGVVSPRANLGEIDHDAIRIRTELCDNRG